MSTTHSSRASIPTTTTAVAAVAAIDIGATKTLVTVRPFPLGDAWSRRPGATIGFPTERDPDREVERVGQAVDRLRGRARLHAAGCSAPGPLDASSGVIRRSPNLGWRELPLGDLLGARLGVPVAVDDDAHLGALGEAILGAGRGVRTVAYLTFSSGVGSGIVIDGSIHQGDHGAAGEVGHLTVDPAGPRCGCGRRGDVESYVGGRSLARRAGVAWPDRRLAGGAPAPRDADGIFAAAAAGDPIARALVGEATEAAARAIAALAATLDPGVIVVGGSIGLGQRRFVRAATALARRRALAETGRRLATGPAALAGESVLAGAAVAAARLASGGTAR
jgi:glucokinase